jgi:hypothetical protein
MIEPRELDNLLNKELKIPREVLDVLVELFGLLMLKLIEADPHPQCI